MSELRFDGRVAIVTGAARGRSQLCFNSKFSFNLILKAWVENMHYCWPREGQRL
jgi:hypothetical protein